MSDAFWNTLPTLVTSVVAAVGSITAVIVSLKGNKKVDEVAKGVDGAMTKLLAAKDETAKAKDDSQKLIDAKSAAFNEGKLSEMGKQLVKDDPKIIEQTVETQTVENQDVKKTTPPKK